MGIHLESLLHARAYVGPLFRNTWITVSALLWVWPILFLLAVIVGAGALRRGKMG